VLTAPLFNSTSDEQCFLHARIEETNSEDQIEFKVSSYRRYIHTCKKNITHRDVGSSLEMCHSVGAAHGVSQAAYDKWWRETAEFKNYGRKLKTISRWRREDGKEKYVKNV